MYNIATGEFAFTNWVLWVDLGLAVALIVTSLYFVFYLFKRRVARYIAIGLYVGILIAWFFGLSVTFYILLVTTTILMTIFGVINSQELRPMIVNTLASSRSNPFSRKLNANKIYDRELVYEKVFTAVKYLSEHRIGALMTFERNVPMDDIAKSGTILEAPITPELLITIFYPGTRLHDGAVIIRRDQIYAAAVYYTPTTKALTGKYGSRHRAAIGISEITDSVTVVVSEETGRISLAVGGDLIHIQGIDQFRRVFDEYAGPKDIND